MKRAAIALCFTLFASEARAELGYGGHAAYFVGGGTREPGIRHGGDFFAGLGWMHTNGSRDGLWDSGKGTLLGVSAVVGIGDAPTYVIPEIAKVEHTTLAGVAGAAGLVARTDQKGYGLSLRINGDLLLLQVGLRLVLVAAPNAHAQLSLTLGLGRF